MATSYSLDEEDLQSSEPIHLTNKFDVLLPEDQHEPYEECDIHEEVLISFNAEDLLH